MAEVILGDEGCDNPRPRIRPPWCRVRHQFVTTDVSRTVESPGNDTDVNNIVERFKRTGSLPIADTQPQYADVTGLQGDFTELINKSRETTRKATQYASTWKPTVPSVEPVVQQTTDTPPVSE